MKNQDVLNLLKPVNLHKIGPGIKNLPPAQWETRMSFSGADDIKLKSLTRNKFPHTCKETHPIFILKVIGNLGHEVCPCTSSPFIKKGRFIKKGCQLEYIGNITDKNSYLVEDYRFTLPADPEFRRKLKFRGRVPEACIQEAI
ncbi:MAG: hypothetical protein GY749_36255 [Desulfobacteraceae bacterium]|nr:hypothetical protein [Desulfobacteraceae bacterium]